MTPVLDATPKPRPSEPNRASAGAEHSGTGTSAGTASPCGHTHAPASAGHAPGHAHDHGPGTPDDHHGHSHELFEATEKWPLLLASSGACALFGLGAAAAENFLKAPPAVSNALYVVSYLAGGWHAAEECWQKLRRLGLDVHFLMLLVAVGAFGLGHPAEGAILLFLFSLSGALEHFAEARTERELKALHNHAPRQAMRLDAEGNEHQVPVDQLAVGDRLRLRPGERVPADSHVLSGKTSLDESMITGESIPRVVDRSDLVPAGALLVEGSIDVQVKTLPAQSTLQRMIDLVMQAREQKAPSQRLVDRLGARYTYTILAVVAAYAGILIFTGVSPTDAAYRAMTLLVVSSPCALVLSIPSAVLTAIAAGARHGVLFRNGAAVERLATVSFFAFDKTGTITTGALRLRSMETLGEWSEATALQVIGSAEIASEHPIARSIVAEARRRDLDINPPASFRAIAGEGVEANLADDPAPLFIGTAKFVEDMTGEKLPPAWLGPLDSARLIVVYASHRGRFARILLEDEIRPGARELIAALSRNGCRSAIISGDLEEPVREIAREVGVAEFHGRQKPEDKLARLNRLSEEGHVLAMVGDGVNDAAALARADVPIVMGSRGSDVALEEAGVVLIGDKLGSLWTALIVSKRARRIIHQNLVISIGAMLGLAAVVVFRGIELPAAVVGHEGSTVVVVLNSLRIFWIARESATRLGKAG